MTSDHAIPSTGFPEAARPAAGVALFTLAYAALAAGPTTVALLAVPFLAAGIAIGCVETAEHAAVAAPAPPDLRGSAFGFLAAVQSLGNLAAKTAAGLLWTLTGPGPAFTYLTAWTLLALLLITRSTAARRSHPAP